MSLRKKVGKISNTSLGKQDIVVRSPPSMGGGVKGKLKRQEQGIADKGGDYFDVTKAFETNHIFNSRDELNSWAKQKATEVGMVLVSTKSDFYKSDTRLPRFILGCQLQGKRVARSKIERCGCPFLLRGIPCAKEGDKWTVEVQCGRHNHPLTTDIKSQPSLPSQKKQRVIEKNIQKYRGQLPQYFEPFVEKIEEIDRDGNCGFRALAKGLWSDENKWEDVRRGCLEELNAFENLYVKMFGGSETIKELREKIDYFSSPCRRKYWFMMPEMGFLFASRFSVVVVNVSDSDVSTILPLHSWAPSELQIICIKFVDNNHSVCIKLGENAPLPRPMPLWKKHMHMCASGWESRLGARMEAYDSIRPVDESASALCVHVVE